jgi:NAD(P)-dependent dehydrogenase (short-subunit alcohol dehydrogenase family)
MKNVLITGAAGNLGKAAVEKFLATGYHVTAIVSIGDKNKLEGTGTLTIYEADLTNEKLVEEMIGKIITKHKTIDAAILTVGGYTSGRIETTDGDTIQKMIELNFCTAYFVARPVFQHMLSPSGRIILIGARPALSPSDGKNAVAYALSKSLVFKLAELLNAEAQGKNVITSVIVPSIIDTPANRKAMPNANFSDWITSAEITNTMLFLASENGKALRDPILKLYGNS